MSESILQRFLNLQFIRTDEVEHLERLQQAAAEVEVHLKENKSEVVGYTLAAIDPQVGEQDPAVVKTEELIIGQWPTFRNYVSGTQDQPTTYIRAVVLQALDAFVNSADTASLIWYSARNAIRYFLLGREKDLLIEFLVKVRESAEGLSRDYWGVGDKIELPEFSGKENEEISLKAININGELLGGHFKAAAVHPHQAGSAGGGDNPHAITDGIGNGNWQWAKFFGERAGQGIAKEVNVVLAKQSAHLVEAAGMIGSTLENFKHGIGPFFQELSEKLLASIDAMGRRNQLLWWKESLYSPSLKMGYRGLKPVEMIFALAQDFAGLSTPVYPNSMDYFLLETYQDLLGEGIHTKIKFSELAEAFGEMDARIAFSLSTMKTSSKKRISLGTAIFSHGLASGSDPMAILRAVGIQKDIELSKAELLLWVFHDLQAMKLIVSKDQVEA